MKRFRWVVACVVPLFACADSSVATDGGGPTPFDDVHEPSFGDINAGAPDDRTLVDDSKADAVLPAQFELGEQSPVKSQGSRGVCSIFAATALIENAYIHAGMPVEEADFSEQYLQWAAKNLGRAFTNTEGSTSEANLQTTVRFGTILEDEWPYESFAWDTFDDPACTGESRPTRCYTNGEPPATAEAATRFKLPARRYLSTRSIKQHLTTKGTGVNVGMTFFYQSWNHRRSVLPINAEYWRQGVVTAPNRDDQTESLRVRAGHAIHIIGWDDNLEVCQRDGQGNEIPDAAGGCKKERGFWLFKNSWGTAGFGIDHPTGPGYGWLSYAYVESYGSAVVADVPRLELPPPPPPPAGPELIFDATPNAAIPDASTAGVTSSIEVTDAGAIDAVKVTVDIAHTFRGDLRVTLEKGAQSVVLFDRSGGGEDNLQATFAATGITGDLAGTWTLKVEDTARVDTGTLKSWRLAVSKRSE
jgi:hypothetical protein